jgi:hypothetical protein
LRTANHWVPELKAMVLVMAKAMVLVTVKAKRLDMEMPTTLKQSPLKPPRLQA